MKNYSLTLGAVLSLAVACFAGCGGKDTPKKSDGGAKPAAKDSSKTAAKSDGAKSDGAKSGEGKTASTKSASKPEGWGTLRGVFKVNGMTPAPAPIVASKDPEVCGKHQLVDESLVVGPGGELANVVISVRSKKVATHPDYPKSPTEPVVFDNKDCRFDPHVAVVRVGQPLMLKNSDPVPHNSNVTPVSNEGINPLLPAAGSVTHKFESAESLPVKVSCNIHPWMSGLVVVADNPYVAVTGKDGSFEIKNLPAGELEFQVWHEKVGNLTAVSLDGKETTWGRGRFTREIAAGENDLKEIVVQAAVFQK